MIRFSTRAEYGVRMMMELARTHGKGPQSLSEIARHEALPAAYLEQLAGKLRRAGLITSRHGSQGGYILSREPAEITLGDVIRVLEGPISPMQCATEGEPHSSCERHEFCTASLVWERVRDSVAMALDSLTLADLIPERSSAAHRMNAPQAIYLQPVDTAHQIRRNATRL